MVQSLGYFQINCLSGDTTTPHNIAQPRSLFIYSPSSLSCILCIIMYPFPFIVRCSLYGWWPPFLMTRRCIVRYSLSILNTRHKLKREKKMWTKKQFNISIPTCYIVGILPFYLSLLNCIIQLAWLLAVASIWKICTFNITLLSLSKTAIKYFFFGDSISDTQLPGSK